MIDWLINLLFKSDKIREALFAEVHFYDQVEAARNEPIANLTWQDGGKWYGYTLNEMHNTYLFDDIGHESMTELWEDLWARDLGWDLMYR